MRLSPLVLLLVLAMSPVLNAAKPEGIRIFPDQIDLTNENSVQLATVQSVLSDGTVGPVVTAKPDFRFLDPSLVALDVSENGLCRITAKKSGTTTLFIECKLPDGTMANAKATIVCRDVEKPRDVEFTNHIQAVLARNNCNMGACHGALAGKAGFKLSLRGYDPVADHFNITKQDGGRRIELSSPAISLFLAKPSGAIEHKGGLRLPPDSEDYAMLAKWIASGAVGPR